MSATSLDKLVPLYWDEAWYLKRYPDIADAVGQGKIANPLIHFLQTGIREGRYPSAAAEHDAQLCGGGAASAPPERIQLEGSSIPLNWPVGGEIGKTFALKLTNGFFHKYLSGPVILDIGFKGGNSNAVPVLAHAIGVDLDYPGYDGIRLPFADETADAVFSSHTLEHAIDAITAIREWFRVVKLGGFIVCIVPHQYLYERKRGLPSVWSGEHLRFYTPGSLLSEFEAALQPNTYRIRHLADNDLAYDYDAHPDQHPYGCYEIELVIEKIRPPPWNLSE